MSLETNPQRGRILATKLHNMFAHEGIFGKTEMPEDILPPEISKGALEHILFITMTVSIDYQREANALWQSGRKTYSDASTRYLFNPEAVSHASIDKVKIDMQKYGLSKKHDKDARTWQTIASTFNDIWDGDPRKLLEACTWNAPEVLAYLQKNNKRFPYLSGKKIGPLWLRMIRDNIGETRLVKLEEVPIPVDVHVARSSLCLGVVTGNYDGALNDAFEKIREVWKESVKGQCIERKTMVALDVDEPLWHLSKYGCTDRDTESGYCRNMLTCPMKEFCVPGKVFVNSKTIELETTKN